LNFYLVLFLFIYLFINSIKSISAFVRGRDNNSCFCISCILALMACTFGKCFYITPYKFPGSTTISSYYCRRICYLYLRELPLICVQVAFVAIGATMVGSINFTKKKGDYVKKGDEVRNPASYSKLLFFQFSSLENVSNWHLFCFDWQFGYFAFGGSTVICVFEKVGIIIGYAAHLLFFRLIISCLKSI
jgi:hypothetical protein